jgi:hypothetical protein
MGWLIQLLPDSALRGRTDPLGKLGKYSPGELVRDWLPSDFASFQFCWLYKQIECSILYIDANAIAIFNEGDWSAIDCFRRNMSDAESS